MFKRLTMTPSGVRVHKHAFDGGAMPFTPTGKPTHIGDGKSNLGTLERYGATRAATVIVGLARGKTPPNRTGACKIKPKAFTVAQADTTFMSIRAGQVGRKNVAATRTVGRGIYQGRPETTVRYELIDTRSDGSYAGFQKHVNHLAEEIGAQLCQDEVFVVHDDGDKRKTVSATRR